MLGVPVDDVDSELDHHHKPNHRILVEDAHRPGLSTHSNSSSSTGEVGGTGRGSRHPATQNLGFENTTIVAKIKFGPHGQNALLKQGNAAFANSNTGKSFRNILKSDISRGNRKRT